MNREITAFGNYNILDELFDYIYSNVLVEDNHDLSDEMVARCLAFLVKSNDETFLRKLVYVWNTYIDNDMWENKDFDWSDVADTIIKKMTDDYVDKLFEV